ncbi:HlyD family efflux transporter periplasmic adaptor subunit [Brevibacillus fluminis]|uniref:HlyD family efflux transporter periplasmic adaptor subunit n=1 Tax=Brevibacillus fluminis TaxID=511487 RepID=A0A3M8DB69_9BACL|nr:HlyD family efflux transporter periplasmic adaptor subunit [Brevibacillus fluminis]RNB84859.1 HlyD family efflux transporter periplasmic adaptor subunit [Brevibacillus fluminis]
MKKNIATIVILIVIAALGGFGLLLGGKDAVSLAMQQKGSIVTAEQINVSFQQVGGKVTNVGVQEEMEVKRGDVMLQLDPTDVNLQIAKVTSDIQSTDIRIKQMQDSIRIGEQKIETQESQASLGIRSAQTAESKILEGTRKEELEKQRLAVDTASESLKNAQTNYDRIHSLYESGAVPKASLDTAYLQVTSAQNSLKQQDETYHQMSRGAQQQDKDQARQATEKAMLGLEVVAQSKAELQNSAMGIDLLIKSREALQIQLESLRVQKDRLTLRAPHDGKIVKVIPKTGENVSAGVPVILLETNQIYYDFYVDETQAAKFKVGQSVAGHLVSTDQDITGMIKFITAAPQFASLRMSREKGQSDLNTFQIRVYPERTKNILPGMTIEVNIK